MAGQVLNPQVPVVDKGGVMSLPFYKYLLSLQTGVTGSYAPIGARYVTTQADPTLTAEKVLTAGTGISVTVGASTVTIAATSGTTADDALTLAWLGL